MALKEPKKATARSLRDVVASTSMRVVQIRLAEYLVKVQTSTAISAPRTEVIIAQFAD